MSQKRLLSLTKIQDVLIAFVTDAYHNDLLFYTMLITAFFGLM